MTTRRRKSPDTEAGPSVAHVRGSQRGEKTPVAEHLFTSGVPLSGNETVRMNLYVFGQPTHPLPPTEVVVESFEYAP